MLDESSLKDGIISQQPPKADTNGFGLRLATNQKYYIFHYLNPTA